MAGGKFTAMNKVRPGAYFNFKAAPRSSAGVGTRGVVALPLVLAWGDDDTVYKITVDEFISGESTNKIGVSLQDNTESAVMLRQAFKGASTALVYKINKNGNKATVTPITGVTVTALKGGTYGNNINILIEELEDTIYNVHTIVGGVIKDTQTIEAVEEFTPNGWIEITGTGDLTEVVSTALTGGTDTDTENYAGFFDAMSTQAWQAMAIPSTAGTAGAKAYIKDLAENSGVYAQVVVNDLAAPDYERVINTKGQGYKNAFGEEITPEIFTCWVAGITAGADTTQSNTYRLVDDAVEIINPLKNSEIEEALSEGYFVLSTRQDGKIVVEQDINSLISFFPDFPKDWRKNKIVRTNDTIATELRKRFELNYIGKVNNDANGRGVFLADCVALLTYMQDIGAIQKFDASTDIEVLPGIELSDIIANFSFQDTDAMEKLYATIILK